MKSAIRLGIVGCAGLAALALSGTALAAFTTPKLTVSNAAGGGLAIQAQAGPQDDAPFRLVIYVPRAYSPTFAQSAGAQAGTVEAIVQAGPGSEVRIPLSGVINPADPAPFRSNPTALGCMVGATIDAVYLLTLRSPVPPDLVVPLYVTVLASGPEAALGSAKLTACLPTPYVAEAQGGARLGAKLLSATLTFPTLFTNPSAGAELRWRSIWTPWTASPALPPAPNAAATVEAQALERRPARVTLRAGRYNARARRLAVSGNAGAAGAVQVFLGNRRVASARAGANGAFVASIRVARRGTYSIRARATVPASETSGCTASIPGVNCLRTTTNGFTATSATLRVRIR
jgi:hypothetical protein